MTVGDSNGNAQLLCRLEQRRTSVVAVTVKHVIRAESLVDRGKLPQIAAWARSFFAEYDSGTHSPYS